MSHSDGKVEERERERAAAAAGPAGSMPALLVTLTLGCGSVINHQETSAAAVVAALLSRRVAGMREEGRDV